jgi:hypothetical protein
MKKITIVEYMAYDQKHTSVFENMSDDEIKKVLKELCKTYVLLKTMYCEVLTEFVKNFKSDFNPAGLPGYLQTDNELEKL